MHFAFFLPQQPDELWRLAPQLDVTHAVTGVPHRRPDTTTWDFASFVQLKQRFADAGLNLSVIEGWPQMRRIHLGLPGRDEEIDQLCQMVTFMGAAGIHTWCYNFMAAFGWLRTSTSTRARGGALVTAYDHSLMEQAPLTEFGIVSEEQLWDNFAYFLTRIIPVAEQAGVKLALHPDDPPLSPIRGIARIFRSAAAFKRAIELVPSDSNGITFCQGSFATMGEPIPETIRYFGELGKIHFVHFRDIRGSAERFVETFHDNGQTDMLQAMRCYEEIGFDGPMRPDHVPTLEGDKNDTPGYTVRGRIYAIGYMRGLLEAVRSSS